MAKLENFQTKQTLMFPEERTPKEAFREIRNYLAGQFVGATRDDVLLEELLKCLFYKMYIEFGYADDLPKNTDSLSLAKHIRSVFQKIKKKFADIYPSDSEILLSPEAISFVLDTCAFSITNSSSDPVGDAFEVFAGSESRSGAGQFFTPRPVTDLLVELVDPKPGEIIIDPAVGAGGFLASVVRYYQISGVSHKKVEGLAKNLVGVDKDTYLAKLAKFHVSLLTGGKPTILCADSIALADEEGSIAKKVPKEGFDVLLTNPPFGSRIVSALPAVLKKFDLAKNWHFNKDSGRWHPSNTFKNQVPPQILFVERCLSLVKDGGRLGMVLPESLISNKSHRFVVQYLLEQAHITAVIGMPESLFKTSGKGGTHTKTCLIVARKIKKRESGDTKIFMAEAKWCGHDSRARTIPHNDLPTIGANIKKYKKTGKTDCSPLGFLIKEHEIKNLVLCPHYYDPKIEENFDLIKKTHHLCLFSDLVKEGTLSVYTGDELGKLAYGTGDIPFIRTSDLSNWEIKIDAKHGIDQEIYERLKAKQDVQPYDIFMVKDGTYLIGTCAIVTPSESKIVYQSHIYKIRVQENKRGLTPFLLLATLSSPIVERQIKAKQFSQDIIDSLGERINELIIPIPKSKAKRDKITNLVGKVIEKRVEARKLSMQARELVGTGNGGHFALRNGV